jgi:hypothetical protein
MNKQSFDPENFSAEGIKVTTANPIYYNVTPESPKDWYLSFDQSNSNDVKAFQDWLDKNHAGWATGYPNGIVAGGSGYGNFGSLTSQAFKQYGNQYLASTTQTGVTSTKPTLLDKAKNAYDKADEMGFIDKALELIGLKKKYSPTSPADDTSSLKNPDKGMSTGAKIAIGVGAAVVLGIIIYTATKKSK